MKVGCLTPHQSEFDRFRSNNTQWECTHVKDTTSLIGLTVDFYVRLRNWKKLEKGVLETIKVQEQLRNLNKTNVIEPLKQQWQGVQSGRFQSGGFTTNGITGKHADKIIKDDPFGSPLIKAWENTPSFFPNMNAAPPPIHPQSRCYNDDMIDSLSGLSAYTQKAMQAMSNFSIRLAEKDLPYLIDKDGITGMQ